MAVFHSTPAGSSNSIVRFSIRVPGATSSTKKVPIFVRPTGSQFSSGVFDNVGNKINILGNHDGSLGYAGTVDFNFDVLTNFGNFFIKSIVDAKCKTQTAY